MDISVRGWGHLVRECTEKNEEARDSLLSADMFLEVAFVCVRPVAPALDAVDDVDPCAYDAPILGVPSDMALEMSTTGEAPEIVVAEVTIKPQTGSFVVVCTFGLASVVFGHR